jgi:hypothetical protein
MTLSNHWSSNKYNIVQLDLTSINFILLNQPPMDKWWIKSVVIKDRERDVQVWKNDKVYFKWGWNKSPFDIHSVVFHFDDFNYGRWSQPFFFNNCNSAGFFFHYQQVWTQKCAVQKASVDVVAMMKIWNKNTGPDFKQK